MPENGDSPASLASLWLKQKSPSRRPEPMPGEAPGGQLGLLFTQPPAANPRGVKSGPSATKTLPTAPQERRVWSVRSLITEVRQHLETGYGDLWVEGEISGCRPAPSGHLYFTLKDGDAQLPVVLFRRQAQLLRFRPQDGLAVLVRGRISIYESRGQLQLIAETLEPRGAGALQLAFEQLRDRLKAEGLFDAARKRPIPPYPRCIGVITSTGGAVLHDILNVIRRRHGRLNLLIYPALMQGHASARAVAAGIRFFNQNPDRADLILLARGGGSAEDLAGFNDEALARAIAASALPVVSAIGHETDFTIADFVADLRAPTPSAAAELITAAQHRIDERVQMLESRLRRAVRYQIVVGRQRLSDLSVERIQMRLQSALGRRDQRLDDLRHRLESVGGRRIRLQSARLASLAARLERHHPAGRVVLVRRRLEIATQSLRRLALAAVSAPATRLDFASARLQALSPLAVLSRGYALVYTADGRLLRDASNTGPGQSIHARLASGSLTADVTKTS